MLFNPPSRVEALVGSMYSLATVSNADVLRTVRVGKAELRKTARPEPVRLLQLLVGMGGSASCLVARLYRPLLGGRYGWGPLYWI